MADGDKLANDLLAMGRRDEHEPLPEIEDELARMERLVLGAEVNVLHGLLMAGDEERLEAFLNSSPFAATS